MCQEYIRQWNLQIPFLEANRIRLVMVSIGVPEKAQILIDHLQIQDGSNYLFVDPENLLYDTLDLNRGIQRTFLNINTPYAFVRRFTQKDGMEDLLNILSKWKDGTSICAWKRKLVTLLSSTIIVCHAIIIFWFDAPILTYYFAFLLCN